MEISLADVKVVIFKERHTIDSSKEPLCTFDIEVVEIKEIDFNRFYCARLLERVLNFEKDWLKAFLEYQCKLKSTPIPWLNSLEQLLKINGELLIQFGFLKELTDLFTLIEEQRNTFTQYESNRPKLQIVDTAEEKTIGKLKPSTTANEIATPSKLPWNGPTNILADLFFQAMQVKGENGKPLLPANASTIIDFIEQSFYRLDGKPFSRSSLKTYLSPSRPEKRPPDGKGITIKKTSKNKEKE